MKIVPILDYLVSDEDFKKFQTILRNRGYARIVGSGNNGHIFSKEKLPHGRLAPPEVMDFFGVHPLYMEPLNTVY